MTTPVPSKERLTDETISVLIECFEDSSLQATPLRRECVVRALRELQEYRAVHEPEAIPRAWFRVHHTPDSINGPAEADIDMAWGDQPEGDGWKPLYLRPAPPPVPALDYHKLCDALQQAMLHAFVPDMETECETDYRFVDLMSDPDSTIETGKRRIEIFAERIADAVLEHLDSPTLTKGASDAG